jgi:septal ring factor EnvC (AmiA/AmiB activator)
MKKMMNSKVPSFLLVSIFSFVFAFSVNADEMKLEEAKAEITRLEEENASLKQELELYEKHIAEHKARLEEQDSAIMALKPEE